MELGIVKGDGKQLLPKSSTQCQQALAMFFRSYLTLQAWMEDSVDPDGRPEADALVEFALQYVGYNYIWGGKDPSTGFDCSGFVWYVYTHNGYEDIGRTATDQWYYENSQEVSQDSPAARRPVVLLRNRQSGQYHPRGYLHRRRRVCPRGQLPGRCHRNRRGRPLLRGALHRRPPDHPRMTTT